MHDFNGVDFQLQTVRLVQGHENGTDRGDEHHDSHGHAEYNESADYAAQRQRTAAEARSRDVVNVRRDNVDVWLLVRLERVDRSSYIQARTCHAAIVSRLGNPNRESTALDA